MRELERLNGLTGRIGIRCSNPDCRELELRWAIYSHVCRACRYHPQINGNGHAFASEHRLVNGVVAPRSLQEADDTQTGGHTNHTARAESSARNRSNTDPLDAPGGAPGGAPGVLRRTTTQTQIAHASAQATAPLAIHGNQPSISTQASSGHSRQDSLASNASQGVFYIPEGEEAGDIPASVMRRLQMEREAHQREVERERAERERQRRCSD